MRERIKHTCGDPDCENHWLGYTPFVHSKTLYSSLHLDVGEDISNTKYNGLISVMDYDGNQYILTPRINREVVPQFNPDSASAQAITRAANRVANLGAALCDLNDDEAVALYVRLRDSMPMDNPDCKWIHDATIDRLKYRLALAHRLRIDGTVKPASERLFPLED